MIDRTREAEIVSLIATSEYVAVAEVQEQFGLTYADTRALFDTLCEHGCLEYTENLAFRVHADRLKAFADRPTKASVSKELEAALEHARIWVSFLTRSLDKDGPDADLLRLLHQCNIIRKQFEEIEQQLSQCDENDEKRIAHLREQIGYWGEDLPKDVPEEIPDDEDGETDVPPIRMDSRKLDSDAARRVLFPEEYPDDEDEADENDENALPDGGTDETGNTLHEAHDNPLPPDADEDEGDDADESGEDGEADEDGDTGMSVLEQLLGKQPRCTFDELRGGIGSSTPPPWPIAEAIRQFRDRMAIERTDGGPTFLRVAWKDAPILIGLSVRGRTLVLTDESMPRDTLADGDVPFLPETFGVRRNGPALEIEADAEQTIPALSRLLAAHDLLETFGGDVRALAERLKATVGLTGASTRASVCTALRDRFFARKDESDYDELAAIVRLLDAVSAMTDKGFEQLLRFVS